MKSYSAAVAFAGLVSSVAAHGYISSPKPRMPGDGLSKVCGPQVGSQQSSDHFGNVQGSIQQMGQGGGLAGFPDCKIWQCKGVPFDDASEVFDYSAGQKVPMKVEIRAPHDGVANVSIVKTSSDTVIGKPLISWDKYALTSEPMSGHPEWTSFDITMPDVSSDCAKGGDCVIQWYWDAPSIDQTYEACIDFKMGGGSGSGSAQPSGSVAASSAAPSKTAAAQSSAAPATSAAATSAAASATSAAASPSASAPAKVEETGSDEGSDSSLPKSFTIDTFITWLRANAGSDVANKVRRAHARAFRV